tara:strand:+ start:494 stop:1078 length:585 start_codon:yes stop_codon:yes gene_type:complete
MIYPATYDITILQNATWSGTFRATQNRRELTGITIAGTTPTFALPCHGFVANDKVVFTGGTDVPCGLSLNTVYFVMSTGLSADAFQVSATSGGATISTTGTATGTFYVATPLNITGYTIDSDIKGLIDGVQVATFTAALTTPADGEFTLSLLPATTSGISVGRYGYDVSLTQGSGARYYWLTGVATVQLTYSRN